MAPMPLKRRNHGTVRSPTVKRNAQSQVTLKGWLLKLEGGAIRQWKQRWCVLVDFCLFSYKNPCEEKVTSTILLPSYKINPCSSEDKISKKFAFKAEHQNMKSYYFAAEDKESMKKWMNALSLASIMQKFNSSGNSVDEDSEFSSCYFPNQNREELESSSRENSACDFIKQRLYSYNEKPGGIIFQSDIDHSDLFGSVQFFSKKQPVYVNAPPKPKRLIQGGDACDSFVNYMDSCGNVENEVNFLSMTDEPSDVSYLKASSSANSKMNPTKHNHLHSASDNACDSFVNYVDSCGNVENKVKFLSLTGEPSEVTQLNASSNANHKMKYDPLHSSNCDHCCRVSQCTNMYQCTKVPMYSDEDEDFDNYRNAVRVQADYLYLNNQSYMSLSGAKTPRKFPVIYYDDKLVHHSTCSPSKTANCVKQSSREVVCLKKNLESSDSMQRLKKWKEHMMQSPLCRKIPTGTDAKSVFEHQVSYACGMLSCVDNNENVSSQDSYQQNPSILLDLNQASCVEVQNFCQTSCSLPKLARSTSEVSEMPNSNDIGKQLRVKYHPVETETDHYSDDSGKKISHRFDEASWDSDHGSSPCLFQRRRDALESQKAGISQEVKHIRKLFNQTQGLMNKGKQLSVSAGDLLEKTPEELVLLLIHFRRNQNTILKARKKLEKCLKLLEIDSFALAKEESSSRHKLSQQILRLQKQYEMNRPIVMLVDNMIKLGTLYGSRNQRSFSLPSLNYSSKESLIQSIAKVDLQRTNDSECKDLEVELTRLQSVLEELANHRHEINNSVERLRSEATFDSSKCAEVRASPTGVAGSAPLPLRKKQVSVYLETDLDTMVTCDLATAKEDWEDMPLYANADEIALPNEETGVSCEISKPDASGEELSTWQDISEADERMKRFYGILPKEKPFEIKTVRIVKRQSELRSREKVKKKTIEEPFCWVSEEQDSSDDNLEGAEGCSQSTSDIAINQSCSLDLNPRSKKNKPLAQEYRFESLQQAATKKPKRRHTTVSGYQYLLDPQFAHYFSEMPRSRDDVDMERCLRTANTPDIVRSTIKKRDVFDETVIDREIGLPEKIEIPERYVELEPECLSASERLKRSLKAENICKMLSKTASLYGESSEKSLMNEEKQKLLSLNQALAREVVEKSKAVAAPGNSVP